MRTIINLPDNKGFRLLAKVSLVSPGYFIQFIKMSLNFLFLPLNRV